MRDPEHSMLAFGYLADLSQQKSQAIGRDKFLVLTAVAACQAGYLEVAEQCRELVLRSNPNHMLHRWPSVADALRSDEFCALLIPLERFCSFEQAEHLLSGLQVDFDEPTPGKRVAKLFEEPHWSEVVR